MTQDVFEDKFERVGKIDRGDNVCLKSLSSYKIGGVARTVWYPVNAVELMELVDYFDFLKEPYWIVGGGANTIFDDGDIETALISTSKLNQISVEEMTITAGAGVNLDLLVRTAVESGLQGFEKLSGIPGSVGGATWMNAGAYGSEIGDFVTKVTAVADGKVVTLSREDCQFSYRSAVALKDLIVVEVEWELSKGDVSELTAVRKDILARRAEKQPLDFPSCGSVFKRPVGDYASRLIDEAGLKGFRIGDAQVSDKHAGFIINKGNATAADVFAVIQHCQKVVKEKFGVELQLEQQVLKK